MNRLNSKGTGRLTVAGAAAAILIVCSVCTFAGIESAAGLDLSEWPRMATIEPKSIEEGRAVRIVLPPEVVEAALPGLPDLRIVGDGGTEIGHLVRENRGTTTRKALPVKLLNRTFVPGRQSSVTVDFGGRVVKNQVDVLTTGTNFRRKVRIEASSDGTSWQMVRRTAFLFKVAGQDGTAGYEKRTITFPDNDMRFLRVSVEPGPDDPEVVTIEDVRVGQDIRSQPVTEPVSDLRHSVHRKQRSTEIMLDTGFRNIPFEEVSLQVADRNFLRRVVVSGRNEEKMTIKGPVSDAPTTYRTVDAPWTTLAEGSIYRFTDGDSVEESLSVQLNGKRSRYLKLTIRDQDDPPLQISDVRITRLVQFLSFVTRGDRSYSLFVGNPKAIAPVYDVGHYLDRVQGRGVITAHLGPLVENPEFKAQEKRLPWSERYRALIWAALILLVLGFVLLLYRMVKNPPAATHEPDGERNSSE